MNNKKENLHLLISYEEKKEIGQDGKNSKTYLAFDKNLKREIVVKELNKEDGWDIDDYYAEARILNEVKHPNVVEIILAGEQIVSDGDDLKHVEKICLAMPYYKNGSLNDLLKKGNIPDKYKSSLVLNVLHGLSSIHLKRLMHLDLKPDNILISDRNEALISDFGISQHLKRTKDFVKWKNGMKMYPLLAPPEIMNVKVPSISRKTDIYHIGILIYLIYTEQTLEEFTGIHDIKTTPSNVMQNYYQKVENGEWYVENKKIPKKVSTIIKKCLNVNPKKRYSSVNDIHNAFNLI